MKPVSAGRSRDRVLRVFLPRLAITPPAGAVIFWEIIEDGLNAKFVCVLNDFIYKSASVFTIRVRILFCFAI